MRILVLSDRIPPENRGGAEVAAWNLAKGLQQAGHEVHAIAATPGEPFEEVRDGIATYHIHANYPERFVPYLSLYNPQTIRHVRRLYRKIQPDVVNAHNIHNELSYFCLTLANRMGLPTVFSTHDVMPFAYAKLDHWVDPKVCGVSSPAAYRLPKGYNRRQARLRYNPFRNRVIRNILTNNTQARNTPSLALKQAHEANDLPPYKVIPYGFDVEQFQVSPEGVEALRDGLGIRGRKIILFAGRLTGGKGVVQVMQALDQVVKQVPEALLLVLSRRDIRAQVQQPEFQHLLGVHVQTGGWLTGDDLIAAYYLADVVTVPSIIMDTFPVINLEAMAAGKPVVATCYGGSPEAVVDGETGYIVNPFDTDQFAGRLIQLLSDDDLRHAMGRQAWLYVQETFPIQRQVREMVTLYQSAIEVFQRP